MLRGDKRVEVLEAELTRVRRAFEAALDAVPEAKRQLAPPGRWSAAQIVWHLAKVERSVARLIERKNAEIGPMATVPPGPSSHAVLKVLDHVPFLDRSRRLEAPEGIRPPEQVDLVAERGRLADGRVQLLAAAYESGPRLSLIQHPHVYFGDFNGWQWLLMVARHEERHLLQLQETVAALG
ncbi:DinB family protein [Pseudogemmatithrix spongiicola]|uniref:DinB family protein n=1 Tax=Pseudogemmatithrix spongiicola TaxID=3062599 RepID=A0AA49JZM6_9BACT|nr:DinB family protein [Gemmatimonadaceae bacterium 'strain 138']WKW15190.1 DinB family protein [Gemmatimonadaceae bacterium 'strain 318']